MTLRPPTASTAPVGVPVKAGPLSALGRGFQGAFQTEGRSSRSEYWWFAVVVGVLVGVVATVERGLGGAGWVTLLVVLVILAPSISVCVRRLHDAGYSGGWYFIGFLPFIGGFWLLILLIQPSQRLRNRFGTGPDDHKLV